MDSIDQVKEALKTRAQSASLDELQSRGTKRVRLIRAGDIIGLIDAAVQRTIGQSGLVSPDDAERLAAESRAEFQSLQGQLAEAREQASTIEQLRIENDALRTELVRLTAQVEVLRPPTAPIAPAAAPEPAAPPAPEANAEEAAGGQLLDVLNQFQDTMNSRLDQFGRKMGISSAVEADAVQLDGLFKNMDDTSMESNIEDMQVKQRTSSGIAANLARLKKLKGSGGE